MRRAIQSAASIISGAQRSIMSGNNGLPQAFAWRTQHKAPQSGVVLPRKGSFFCARKVGFDVSIWIRARGAVFFLWCAILFFVVLRSLASFGHLKDRDLCVWKSGKDARKLTINNKFHVKHSDGWRSFT